MMSANEAAGTRRRVKLYVLNEDRQWDDRGTGHVSAMHSDKHKGNALVVISEMDGTCLLESKILSDTAYQKQQETLIVWSEGENNDLALSFQEKMGCDEIWEKICSVQGKDPSVDITQDVTDNESDEADDAESETCPMTSTTGSMELPPCELARLDDILDLVAQASTSIIKRDRLATSLERGTYIKELINLFHKAEDLDDMDALHHLYEIIRHIISFNKHGLYDVLFSDELILDVVGILEYDPACSPGKSHHREFLKSKSHFREVLPMHNPDLKARIHQTYRVQYIQECCLPPPSLFEENMVSSLSSFIFFNKIEIVTALQEDEKMMRHLFNQMVDDDADDHRRQELALFLKELCSLSTTMQAAARDNFFRSLCSFGALRALELLLTLDDTVARGAALSILNHFLDCTPALLRDFMIREASDGRNDDELFINILVDHMLNDEDPELGSALQISYMIRALTDPESMAATTMSYTSAIFQRNEKTEFLNFFYKRCMPYLVEPFTSNVTVDDSLVRDDYRTALLISYIFELLTFCVEHHTHCIKNFFMTKDVVRRAMCHVISDHKFLVLGAIRFLRKLIGMKEEFYHRFIIKHDLFSYIAPLFRKNRYRYNLIDSALVELFEYIRHEDIRPLISHIVEFHWDHLVDINYVSTFQALLTRHEQIIKMKGDNSPGVNPPVGSCALGSHGIAHSDVKLNPQTASSSFRRGGIPGSCRTALSATAGIEDEDEMWLDEEEEEEAPTFAPSNHQKVMVAFGDQASDEQPAQGETESASDDRLNVDALFASSVPSKAEVSDAHADKAEESSTAVAATAATTKSEASDSSEGEDDSADSSKSVEEVCQNEQSDVETEDTSEKEKSDSDQGQAKGDKEGDDASDTPRTLGLVDYSSDEEEEEEEAETPQSDAGLARAPTGEIGPRLLPLIPNRPETGRSPTSSSGSAAAADSGLDDEDEADQPCRKRLRLDSMEDGQDGPSS